MLRLRVNWNIENLKKDMFVAKKPALSNWVSRQKIRTKLEVGQTQPASALLRYHPFLLHHLSPTPSSLNCHLSWECQHQSWKHMQTPLTWDSMFNFSIFISSVSSILTSLVETTFSDINFSLMQPDLGGWCSANQLSLDGGTSYSDAQISGLLSGAG